MEVTFGGGPLGRSRSVSSAPQLLINALKNLNKSKSIDHSNNNSNNNNSNNSNSNITKDRATTIVFGKSLSSSAPSSGRVLTRMNSEGDMNGESAEKGECQSDGEDSENAEKTTHLSLNENRRKSMSLVVDGEEVTSPIVPRADPHTLSLSIREVEYKKTAHLSASLTSSRTSLVISESYDYHSAPNSPHSSLKKSTNQNSSDESTRTSSSSLSPLTSTVLPDSSEVVYTEADKRVLSAGTVDALVAMLAGESIGDKDFVSNFVLSHQQFVGNLDLLEKLICRYNISPRPEDLASEEANSTFNKKRLIIQVRVINVIKKWIEGNLSDFADDEQLVARLQQFVQGLLSSGRTESVWASNLQTTLSQATELKIQRAQELAGPATGIIEETTPKPFIPRPLPPLLTFLSITPLELARQLTLIEHRAFCQLTPKEYLNKSWQIGKKISTSEGTSVADYVRKEGNQGTSFVLDIINRFNRTSYWIATEIVQTVDLSNRVRVLGQVLKLAAKLREMNNYQGVMIVFSALSSGPIQRLQETWKALPSKRMQVYKDLEILMTTTSNYKIYRDLVKNAMPPLIPFQAIYLSDFTFIEESPDFLDNGMVNFTKMALIGDKLREMQRYQQVKYSFHSHETIQKFLNSVKTMDEAALYKQSRIVEPKKE